MNELTLSDIERIVAEKTPESSTLDFKSGDIKGDDQFLRKFKIEKIAKTVSAFANSNGGQIIIGVKENSEKGSNLPSRAEKIVPIMEMNKLSDEAFAKAIDENIIPKIAIEDIHIYPIEHPDGIIIVIDVKRSGSAPHQVKLNQNTYGYYARRQFQNLQMEHFEIEDIRNRQFIQTPDVRLIFEQGPILMHNELPLYFNAVIANHSKQPIFDLSFELPSELKQNDFGFMNLYRFKTRALNSEGEITLRVDNLEKFYELNLHEKEHEITLNYSDYSTKPFTKNYFLNKHCFEFDPRLQKDQIPERLQDIKGSIEGLKQAIQSYTGIY